MTIAPFDRYLASLKDGDSESTKMQKLLAAYNLRKQGGDYVAVRKQDAEDEDALVAEEIAEGEGGDADLAEELDEEEDDRQDEEARKHLASQVADLFVEAHEGRLTRPEALRHLMHTPRGAELLRRLHLAQKLQKRKERTSMTHTEQLALIAKEAGGLAAICKHVINGSSLIASEHELVQLARDSVPRREGETRERAFSRAFCDPDTGLAKAVAVLKTFSTMQPAHKQAVGSSGALAALEEKAAELRKAHPEMTREQSFAKIYTDPSNIGLAAWERQQNRPHA
jgi:hypothetical protein